MMNNKELDRAVAQAMGLSSVNGCADWKRTVDQQNVEIEMNKQQEALKLALEALEVLGWQPTEEAMDYRDNAIDAIREALAEQPAQQAPKWQGVRFDSALHEQPAQQHCKLCGDSFSNFNLEGAVCGDCAHGIEKPVLTEQPAQQGENK